MLMINVLETDADAHHTRHQVVWVDAWLLSSGKIPTAYLRKQAVPLLRMHDELVCL